MRRTPAGTIAAGLLAALLATACSASVTTTRPATAGSCYAFGIQALRRHIAVTRMPSACAGLSQEQVNEAVARAIRTVIGARPKAAGRRLAAADSRYLASLIRPVRVLPATSPGAGPATSPGAGPATSSAGLPVRLAALAAWIATAAAGIYLLAGWLTGDRWRGRRIRMTGVPPSLLLGHAGLAVAGLGIWLAFAVTAEPALGWIDVGLTCVIAGLGMATLIAAVPEHQSGPAGGHTAPGFAAETSTAAFPAKAPVIIIALHGAFATVTILLVLLAAIAAR